MTCILCNRNNASHLHHIWFGKGIRDIADEYNLKINLCVYCHTKCHNNKKVYQIMICKKLNLNFNIINRIMYKNKKDWNMIELTYMENLKNIIKIKLLKYGVNL